MIDYGVKCYATFTPRDNEVYVLKPECRAEIGRRVLVIARDEIDDRQLYRGEQEFDLHVSEPIGGLPVWFASGDLSNIEVAQ